MERSPPRRNPLRSGFVIVGILLQSRPHARKQQRRHPFDKPPRANDRMAAHTTFAGLFSDASRDPFLIDGRYQALLDPFNIDATVNNPQPIAVRQMIAASANQHLPIALLALVEERLTPLFLPFRRDRAIGVPEHPATDNRIFAFEGELIGTQGYLVEVPDDAFNLSNRMLLPEVGLVRGLLAADPHVTIVGPFADGEANTSPARTRFVVPIPNKYAGLFLAHPGGIPPRYYFDTILPVIEADGMAATCEPLTRFCLAAITRGPNHVSAVQMEPFSPPVGRHVPLLEQTAAILATHLSGLRRVTAPEVICSPSSTPSSLGSNNANRNRRLRVSTGSSRSKPRWRHG